MHIVPVIFLLNTLIGNAKTLPAVILYYSTLSSTNNGTTSTPVIFVGESPREPFTSFGTW